MPTRPSATVSRRRAGSPLAGTPKAKPRKSKAPKTSGGDCYEAAAKYILSVGNPAFGGTTGAAENLIVVHAEVMGQGPLEGTTFGHGFVVDKSSDTVIDKSNGRNLHLPRVLYYAIGQIEYIGNIHEYTCNEVAEKMLESGHYGPWDLKTSSGL